MALRTVGVKLAAEVSSYVAGMRTAKTATKDFAGELDRAAKAGQLDAVADQAGRMGLALAAGFAVAVGAAARFDKQMSEVGAVSNATGADLERLRQAALKAGKDTAFSATEAAKAEAELAKAGLATSDILGGALSGSLSLAAAGSLDLAESADIAAKTMNVFQLEGKDVGHIADVLAASANKSATDVHEMGEALRMGGLAAKSSGMSLEETVGTLSAFADRALVGSDAGTSLKTMLQMLAAPSEKAANLMEQLGIHAYDLQGNFVGTTRLASQLQTALGGLTQEQRNAAMATIFGADAMRAANVLFEVGESGVRDYTAAVDDQGAAADVAAKKMDNLAGDVEKLKGSLETMAIEAGSGANSGLRQLVQMGNALVDQFGALHPLVSQSVVVLAGVGGAALLGVAGMIRLRRASAEALEELRRIGPMGEKAAVGLEKTGKHARRAGIALAALQVVGAIGQTFADAATNVQLLATALEEFNQTGKASGELARVYGKDLRQLDDDMQVLSRNTLKELERAASIETFGGLLPIAQWFDDSMSNTLERTKALDAALAQLVQGGNAAAAAAQFDELRDRAAEAGISQEQLVNLFPQYAQAISEAGGATDKTASEMANLAGAAGQTAEEVEELKNAFDRLFEIQMDADRALIAYKEGMAELTEELREGKRTLDTNTAAGRDNATALLDQVENIKNLRDANIDSGMSIDDANAKYKQQIAGLIALGIKLGYNEQQIRDLIGAYGEIPGQVETTVTAPGATTATKQVETFNFAIKNVPPSKTVPFYASTGEAKAAVEALRLKIDSLPKSKTVRVNVFWTQSGDMHVPGGTQLKNDRGGIYEHAAVGKLRDAHIASPMGPARYAYAEPVTGGEAFIPKFGDLNRSRDIWAYVGEKWLGMRAAPAMGGGSAVDLGPLLVAVQSLDGRVAALIHALPRATLRLDDRTARFADLLVRGG